MKITCFARNVTCLAAAALLAAGSVLAQSADQMLARATPIVKLPQYRAKFISSVANQPDVANYGTIYGSVAKDGSICSRIENVTEIPIGKSVNKMTVVVLTIHGKVYELLPDQNRAFEAPKPAAQISAVLTNAAYFSLSLRQHETLDGHDCYVLIKTFTEEGKELQMHASSAQLPNPFSIAIQELWVDSANYWIVQDIERDDGNQIIGKTKYSEIQTNVILPPELFQLPAGCEISSFNNVKSMIKGVLHEVKDKHLALSAAASSNSIFSSYSLIAMVLVAQILLVIIWRLVAVKR